jgi:putative metalloprotease
MLNTKKLGIRKLTAALVLLSAALGLTGCNEAMVRQGVSVASKGLQAATLTDAQIASLSAKGVAQMDSEHAIAPPGSVYDKRLKRLTGDFQSVQGKRLNYKAYLTNEVNAFATPDGSIRVFSGLMDRLNDDELVFVIGHEVGHVFHKHSKKRYQTALATSAARDALAAVPGGDIAAIASSQAGDLLENVINAQYSQANELEADRYGVQALTKSGRPKASAVSALRKIGEGSGPGQPFAQLTATHPRPEERAKKIERALASGG